MRDLDVTSVITTPQHGAAVDTTVHVAGWAWSAVPVTAVEVAVDGRWHRAELGPRGPQHSWQRFTVRVADLPAGGHVLGVRATDADHRTQPLDGARNAVHEVQVSVGSRPLR